MAGYHSPVWKQILYAATVLCTLGVSWIFAALWPAVIILLRLHPCSVQSASFVKFRVSWRNCDISLSRSLKNELTDLYVGCSCTAAKWFCLEFSLLPTEGQHQQLDYRR